MSILDDLPGIVSDALGDLFSDAVLTVTATGESDGQGGFLPGRDDPVTCKALVDKYSDYRHAAGIPATDRKIIVLAASLPAGIVPAVGGRICAQGRTWTIQRVDRDPASATYELQAR